MQIRKIGVGLFLVLVSACSSGTKKVSSNSTVSKAKVKPQTGSPNSAQTANLTKPVVSANGSTVGAAPNDVAKARDLKKETKSFAQELVLGAGQKNNKSLKELKNLAKGYDFLIPTEKNLEIRATHQISLGAIELEIAKKYRLLGKQDSRALEEKSLEHARNLFAEAAESTSNPATKSRAYYYTGLTAIYLGNQDGTLVAFTEAINVDRKNPAVSQMHFYIGEIYFEKNDFGKALEAYRAIGKDVDQSLLTMASYKSAWCFINLQSYSNARSTLLQIANAKPPNNFSEDAFKDLAFLATLSLSEAELIEFGKNEIAKVVNSAKKETARERLLRFYMNVYQVYLGQSSNVERPLVLRELLALERRPEQRVLIRTMSLRSHQKEFAAERPALDMEAILQELNAAPKIQSGDVFQIFGKALEIEIKKITNAYWDTYQGKVRSSETISSDKILQRLSTYLSTYLKLFPEGDAVVDTIELSFQICTKLNDPKCTYQTGKSALGFKVAAKNQFNYRLAVVASLDQLRQKESKYAAEFETQSLIYLLAKKGGPDLSATIQNLQITDIAKMIPNPTEMPMESKLWIDVCKSLLTYLHGKSAFPKAEPFAKALYQYEPNVQNRYRVVFNLYSQEKFAEIYNLKIPANEATSDAELKAVLINTYSKLLTKKLTATAEPKAEKTEKAEKTADTKPIPDINDVSSFSTEEMITQFEALGPNRQQVLQARAANTLLKMNAAEETLEKNPKVSTPDLTNPMAGISFQDKVSKEFLPVWTKFVLSSLRKQNHSTAVSELSGCHDDKECPGLFDDYFISQYALGKEADPETIAKLNNKTSNSKVTVELLLSHLLLTDSDAMLKFANSLNGNPAYSETTKKYLSLFNSIKEANEKKVEIEVVDLSIEQPVAKLGLTSGVRNLIVYKKMAGMIFPTSNMPSAKVTGMIQRLVPDVHYLRTLVPRALKTANRKVSLDLLQMAVLMEKKMANSILTSPIPEGLQPAQVQEYKAGIQNLATEYIEQAAEFEKLLTKMINQAKGQNELIQTLVSTDLSKWVMPTLPKGSEVNAHIAKKNFRAAYAALDYHLRHEGLAAKDYLAWSIYLQLSANKSVASVQYLSGIAKANDPSLYERWQQWK